MYKALSIRGDCVYLPCVYSLFRDLDVSERHTNNRYTVHTFDQPDCYRAITIIIKLPLWLSLLPQKLT